MHHNNAKYRRLIRTLSRARSLLLLLLLLCALPACTKRQHGTPVDAAQLHSQSQALASGLTIIESPMPAAPISGAVLVVGSGGSSDPEGKAGLAHYVEHLVFRSKPDGGTSFFNSLHGLNAVSWNGTTDGDRTEYFAFVAPDELPALVELLGNVMADPLAGVDETIFEQERSIVRNELRLRSENGAPGEIMSKIRGMAFPAGHPYSRPVGGTHESLGQITLEDARQFAKEHYHPSNMTLVLVGNLETRQQLLTKLPESLRKPTGTQKPNKATVPPITDVPKGKMAELSSAVGTPELWIAWTLPSVHSERGVSVELAEYFASSVSESSTFRSDEDIAGHATFLIAEQNASLLVTRVVLKEGNDPKAAAESAIHQINKAVRSASKGRRSFKLFRASLLNHQMFALEDPRARALSVARWAHARGAANGLQLRLQQLAKSSRQEVARIGFDFLDEDAAHVVFVKPLPPDQQPPDGPVGFGGAEANEDPPLPNRGLDEIALVTETPGAAHATHAKLDNGLEVIVLRRPGLSYWTALLGFRQRPLQGEAPGTIHALRETSSAGGPSAAYIMKGISLSSSLSATSAYEMARSWNDDLNEGLKVLFERRSKLPQRWPTRYFERQLDARRARENTPQAQVARQLGLAVAATPDYFPTIDEIAKVDLEDIRKHVTAVHRPDNAVLIVVGNVKPKAVVKSARRWFGGWNVPAAERQPDRLSPRTTLPIQSRLLVGHRPKSTQATIRMACLLPPVTPGTRPAAEVLASGLDAKVFSALRGRDGSAYNAGVYMSSSVDGTATLRLRTDVENHRLAEALRRIRAIWNAPHEPPLGRKAVRRFAWEQVQSYNTRFITADDIARAMYRAWNREWPVASVDHYPEQLSKLEPEQLTPLAGHCRNNTVTAIIGDEPTIRRALQELESSPPDSGSPAESKPASPTPSADEADPKSASPAPSGDETEPPPASPAPSGDDAVPASDPLK